MSRVEWTRTEGNDVEAVVAMFVNRERPTSVRITPSRGDGGVDILDRDVGTDHHDEVYQVKSYCEPLTTKQKEDIEKSLDRLLKDPRWKELHVTTWYLVTPWDPTPEAETWLHGLGTARGLNVVWHGLTYADQLAAKYPDVVDFYLHGGRNRIEETYKTVVALVGVDRGEHFDVPSAAARIQGAMPALDSDPHYRYELRFGQAGAPALIPHPGLVMTWISGVANGGPWVAVDVIARCAASVDERPITITGTLFAEIGSDFETALRDFVSYGTPFISPTEAYQGEIDAPGGLGGRLDGAQIRTLPADDDPGADPQLHVQILDPAGTVLATADLDRVDRSQGADGMRVVLEEVHHVFTIEDRYNLAAPATKRTFKLSDVTGKPATAVLAALTFVRYCRAPNVGRVSVRHTPPERGVIDPNWAFAPPGNVESRLDALIEAISALATIQQHTAVPIRVPDLQRISTDESSQWHFVARLLRGEDVMGTYPEGRCLVVELATLIDVPEGESVGVDLPLAARVGGRKIDLGRMEVWLTNATLVERIERDGHTYHAFTTPDRTYRYHRRPDALLVEPVDTPN